MAAAAVRKPISTFIPMTAPPVLEGLVPVSELLLDEDAPALVAVPVPVVIGEVEAELPVPVPVPVPVEVALVDPEEVAALMLNWSD